MDVMPMHAQGRSLPCRRQDGGDRARILGRVFALHVMLAVASPVMVLAQDDPDGGPGTSPEEVPLAQDNQDTPAQEDADATTQENAEPDLETVPVVPVAQDAPDTGSDEPVALDDIVVTAQKRKESIQDVPLTVNAITGQTLEKQGIFEFKDLQTLVPGLQLESQDPRSPVATLRGIGYDPNSNAVPTVDMFFNEVSVVPFVAFQSMFDTDRVEVLRGAQGTLRGTSPGGAITIAPRKPSLSAWDASIGGSFSANDLRNVQLAGGGPLTDSFGIRVAVLSDQNGVDGLHNILTNRDQEGETLAGRVTLSAQLLDSVDATLTYQRLDSELDILIAVESLPDSTRQPHLEASDRKGFAKNKSLLEISSQIATLEINWDDVFAGHTLNMVTGYLPQRQQTWKDFDAGNAWPAADITQYVDVDYVGPPLSQEIRLTSPQDQAWTYMLGVGYLQTEVDVLVIQRSNATTSPDPNTPPQFGYDLYITIPIDSKGGAVFAQTGLQISEKWSAQAGIRQGKSTVEQQLYFTPRNHPANLDQLPGLSNIPLIPADQVHQKPDATTGTFSLSYHVTPDFLTYLSAAKSYRPGGVNLGAPTDIDPNTLLFYEESSRSTELGIKTDWLGGRLRFNIAAFHQPFDGHIARSPLVPYDGDRNGQQDNSFNLTFNGNATVTGTEAEVAYAWGETLQLSLAGSYAKAVFDNAAIPCAKYDANGDPQFTDENGNPGQQFARCRSNGPLGSVPKFSTILTPEYTVPLSAFDLFVRGVYKYDSDREQQDGTKLAGYGVVNLFLGAHNAAQTWEVSLWAKNLFDEVGVYAGRQGELVALSDGSAFGIQGSAQTFESGYTLVYPIRPREFGLTFRYSLGL